MSGYAVDTLLLSLKTGAGASVPVEVDVMGVTVDDGDTPVTWQTAVPDGYGAGVVKGPQSLNVKFVIDYGAGSLTRYLDTNYGKTATVEFVPDPVNAPDYTLTADVVLARGSQDFQVGSVAATTAVWNVTGEGLHPKTITP